MILVTGGAGFIGSNFVLDWLARSDEPVVNLDALTYDGNTENLASLAGDLLHESADDIATYMNKQNRYSSLHAQMLFRQGVRAGYWRLAASPVARFVKFYLLRRGFLDGGPGFAHIVIGCTNSFQKYLKLMELQQGARAKAPEGAAR